MPQRLGETRLPGSHHRTPSLSLVDLSETNRVHMQPEQDTRVCFRLLNPAADPCARMPYQNHQAYQSKAVP